MPPVNPALDQKIKSGDLAAGAVDAAAIGTGAVGAPEIATDAVDTAEIAANAVGNSEMGDNAIGKAEMADSAVSSAEVEDGTIAPADMTTASRTRVVTIPFKLPAPTGSNQGPFTVATFKLSQAFTVVALKVASDLATTGSDGTNQYQFQGRNLTAAADLHTGPTTTNGAELSTTDPKAITVSQNLSFTANQVFGLKVDISDDGSAGPTNLSGAQLYAILEYTI